MTNWWNNLEKHAKSKYSQCGEEGILEHIFTHVGTVNQVLIDIGASDGYRLSNTRKFLENGWSGFLFESDAEKWGLADSSHDINVARITPNNINELLKSPQKITPWKESRVATCPDLVDLMSLDIDSIDYWVWDALTAVTPRVVVVEFNPVFSPDISITVPNDPNLEFADSLYYGASFTALKRLGEKKGYILVGQVASTNMFFVHNRALPGVMPGSIKVTYDVKSGHPPRDAFEKPWWHVFEKR